MLKEKVFISYQVVKEYRKLLKNCKESINSIDLAIIRQAFTAANNACLLQNQQLYEPRIIQALQIAQIVADDIGLGTDSIICALIYNSLEIESIDKTKVKDLFGNQVLLLSDELIKLSKIDTNNQITQAENFRKLLLSLTSDIRVILVKLAERLFVMRSLDFEEREIQEKVAIETFNLYAPIAHRFGLYQIKSELEDLAMKFTNRVVYDFITKQIQDSAAKRNKFIREIISPIKLELDSQGLDYVIKNRMKSVYSIWNKMQKKNVELEEVYDLFAIRIILNSSSENEKPDCWRAFSIVTSLYQPNPERMRDWISIPKSNGYESLHTTVLVTGNKWVEVQIRSNRMDEIAEKGLAAHWKYKSAKSSDSFDNWLNNMREVIELPDTTSNKLNDKDGLDLKLNEIFVFTPKGDLRKLPNGSTVLDFAYDIHSDIGSKCTGARVNSKNVPIRHVLNNGDKVEILTSKNQSPKSDWLDYVITGKAKSKIKIALQDEKLIEAENGKETFKRRMRNWKIPVDDLLVSKIIKHFKLKNSTDFYSMLASEKINMLEIKSFLASTEKKEIKSAEKIGEVPLEKIIPTLAEKSEDILIIDEKILNNIEYKLARCCNPILGDDIFGFVTINEGIKIHRFNCPNAAQLLRRFEYRVLKASWSGTVGHTSFQATIRLTGDNEIGILSKISDIIVKDTRVNLRSINIDNNENQFDGTIKLLVKDVSHLEMLIHKLLKVKGIKNAQRYDLA
jgi:GTP diphosphokinase / guanosine-3',5'-bis(diphosphate) 3'-diphosphatase